ncbi:MAG: 23S rRNA (adenine(2503)-C(2))-methyltransferase RlmN [Candidatus Eisenbacteria bacterium]|nr:23S rRNA (adenine(2503)-C(2))-methyltransferase RlmN [Candidatus Eisenbacteria bacterium]
MEEARKTDLVGSTPEEIGALLSALDEPPYRGTQIFRWIHRHRARSFREMTVLPLPLREALEARFRIDLPRRTERVGPGPDGAVKDLFLLQDGAAVEAVRIAGEDGATLCVSSQAGCRYGCAFCATARGGFRRSLTAGEIAGQLLVQEEPVRRVVYMGMGEPLANYRNTVRSVRLLVHPEGAAIPPRRITLSTAGLVPLIDRLAAEELGLRLAVSLNASNDEIRRRLMPIAERWPIEALLAAADRFARQSGAPVTFEYVLLAGVNDGDEHARELARRLAPIRCKVNLIPFNPVPSLPWRGPTESRIESFLRILAPRLVATVRRSAGSGIDAACGQLRLRTAPPEERNAR